MVDESNGTIKLFHAFGEKWKLMIFGIFSARLTTVYSGKDLWNKYVVKKFLLWRAQHKRYKKARKWSIGRLQSTKTKCSERSPLVKIVKHRRFNAERIVVACALAAASLSVLRPVILLHFLETLVIYCRCFWYCSTPPDTAFGLVLLLLRCDDPIS